jgi:RHS repeat-associated protein
MMGENVYGYEYDPIGNRIQSAVAVGSGQSLTNIYTANSLNQYSSLQPKDLQPINLSYDLDGNMITNGDWSYTWDAENRMISACSNGLLLITNRYDDQSRRILKSVFEITQSGTNEIRQSSFVYDGWNPIREIRVQESGVSTIYYCWGPDLSGSLQGAGGVGGLQAVIVDGEIPATYYTCYDANGNITAYVDELGNAYAEYAYDAFGNTISQSGDLASTFSHRFSTKYADDETGLYYYGYRYYTPELGRWVNRDPIAERGGLNVYEFVGNDGVGLVDSLGLSMVAPPIPIIFNPGLGAREREWIVVADSISSLIKHWGVNITYDLPGTTPSGTWKGNNIQLSSFFNQQGIILNPYDEPIQISAGFRENYEFVVDKSGRYNDFAHRDAAIAHELVGIAVNKFEGKMSDGKGYGGIPLSASGLQDLSLLIEFGVLAGMRPGYVTHKMLVARGRDYGGLPLSTTRLEDQISNYAKAIKFACACEKGERENQVFESDPPYERTRNPLSTPPEKIKLQSWLKCQGRKISDGGVRVKLWQFKHKPIDA